MYNESMKDHYATSTENSLELIELSPQRGSTRFLTLHEVENLNSCHLVWISLFRGKAVGKIGEIFSFHSMCSKCILFVVNMDFMYFFHDFLCHEFFRHFLQREIVNLGVVWSKTFIKH